jgi:hypothetical protein
MTLAKTERSEYRYLLRSCQEMFAGLLIPQEGVRLGCLASELSLLGYFHGGRRVLVFGIPRFATFFTKSTFNAVSAALARTLSVSALKHSADSPLALARAAKPGQAESIGFRARVEFIHTV